MRVIIRGNWAPYVGTDYCEALGTFDSLDAAMDVAADRSWETWEPDTDEDGIEDEGPDYWIEEYNPDKHDMLRAGGGSFEEDFKALE